MMELKRKYKTVAEAEDAVGITVEHYSEESPGFSASSPDNSQRLSVSPVLLGKMKSLTSSQIIDLVVEGLAALGGGKGGESFITPMTDILISLFADKECDDVIAIVDKLFTWVACRKGLTSDVRTFVQLALQAMKRLDDNNKVNLVLRFCQGLALDRQVRSSDSSPPYAIWLDSTLHRVLYVHKCYAGNSTV